MDGWDDGGVCGWMDRWMDGWVAGWMGGWMDGWTNGWMGGRMEGRMGRWSPQVVVHFMFDVAAGIISNITVLSFSFSMLVVIHAF